MTALLQHITHGRLADLDPFDFPPEVKARARAPARPAVNALAHEAGQAAVEAEFGCVDWFQYPAQGDETKVAH
jgi:hypothetical protein